MVSKPEGILMYFKGFATTQMREDNFKITQIWVLFILQ